MVINPSSLRSATGLIFPRRKIMKKFKENPVKEETKGENNNNAELLIIRSSIRDTISLIISIMVIFVLLATISIIPPQELVINILRLLPLFTLLDCDVRAIFNAIKMRYWVILLGYLCVFIMIIEAVFFVFMTL